MKTAGNRLETADLGELAAPGVVARESSQVTRSGRRKATYKLRTKGSVYLLP